ncbi:MAG: DUF4838 domain-containing protein [Clostridia bacterium]|nr:DUF4838 domain-containing protein [Clostridia bacterium]
METTNKENKAKSTKKIRLIAIIVAAVIALSTVSFFVIRCAVNGKDKDPIVRGLHERTATETDIDLVKEGKTDYVIVLGENEKNEQVLFASSELIQNFSKATGIYLQTKKDSEINYSKDSKVLSIGETSLLQKAGVTFDKGELGSSGYVVKTVGSSVFMVGATGTGSINAVYGWLKEQFGYEYFAIGEVAIDTNVTNEKLLDVTLKEKPDFEYRLANYGEAVGDPINAYRARFNPFHSLWINFDGADYHTAFEIVPPSIYQEEHPTWYSEDDTQLCMSRDPDGLSDVVVERIKKELVANPDRNILTVTQEDVNTWCTCESCTASLNKYGTNSAVYILFMNKVATKVQNWLDETDPDRDVKIAMFAYHQTEEAPVKETKKGYEPMDESLRLHDSLALFYCPIFASYYYDFYSEENINVAQTLDKWSVLAKNIFAWIYGTNFQLYLAPYNNFNSMQNNYRFLYDRGTKYVFDQHQFNQDSGTDWYKLKGYLSSNLQWQIDQSQEDLLDRFFTNYYKGASEAMRKLFDAEQTWFAYLAEHKAYTGEIGYTKSTLFKEDYWPRGLIENWLDIIDEAYKAIEELQVTNPSLHETLHDRITYESLAFRFIQLEMYSVYYSDNELQRMKKSFRDDCNELGVSHYREQEGIASYIGQF